ncbi:glucose-fructose oxidoreductase [Exophiala viscosa]|uniref:Glucose-fructose oxidoreductase n=1 Tax=Exophiala viscosa TaxID=2486360 RepID=A0AAN6IBQ1_9EURO|nr:glucose-fructose oxidoreductase [Exophiala viscosa]KAI1624845.1 glucose-fructose oxidoreductase [Exophiala viscosa]
MTIGVAILGGGIFAREEHKPAVEAAKDLTLKAVYSRSAKSAKTLEVDESKVDIYSDESGSEKGLDALFARTDIKAVIIALPIKNQPEYVRRALLAGKHVLSEKPVAENVEEAVELIKWYHSEIAPKGVTWGVAENVRYTASFLHAAEAVKPKGRQLTFRCRMQTLVEGGKYYETSWRKVPTHQGGFLLDGGVHFTAALRLMLGKDNPLVSLSAHSALLQEHLPPVDTVEATAKSKSGAVGTISISFGTTAKGSEWTVGCEKGFVSVSRKGVTIDDKLEEIEDEKTGVPPEVRAWGEALAAGTVNELQSPEEALADLELIEAMLRSGEQGGVPIKLQHQQL